MTARNDVRRGRVDARGDVRADRGFAADGPTLPERLVEAREQKGVDVYRAERDTKIRVRYLQALEAGDYAELPGAVYTKGFLRNYALYLGLDPDDVVRQWRHEDGDAFVPHAAVLDVPRPLQAPRQGFTFSPVSGTAGGPTAVPFRLCCAHSIIRAGAGGPTSVQCAALGAGAVETPPVPAAGRPAS